MVSSSGISISSGALASEAVLEGAMLEPINPTIFASPPPNTATIVEPSAFLMSPDAIIDEECAEDALLDPRLQDLDADNSLNNATAADVSPSAWIWEEVPVMEMPTRVTRSEIIDCGDYPQFVGAQSGPKFIPSGCTKPSDYFKLFWCNVIMTTFITATNSFGYNKVGQDWKEIDSTELYKFLACIMYMGIYHGYMCM